MCGILYDKITWKSVLISVLQQEIDAIAISVVRSGSNLAPVSIQYYIVPNGNDKFYGGASVLYFEPYETVKRFTVIAKDDGVPQVCSSYTVITSSHYYFHATLGRPLI